MRVSVKVTCDTGKHWTAWINGSFDNAVRYFLGTVFTDETDDGAETRNTVVSVEEVTA